jgi:hypothetical protein
MGGVARMLDFGSLPPRAKANSCALDNNISNNSGFLSVIS